MAMNIEEVGTVMVRRDLSKSVMIAASVAGLLTAGLCTMAICSTAQDMEMSVSSRRRSMQSVGENITSMSKQKAFFNSQYSRQECIMAGCPEGFLKTRKCSNKRARTRVYGHDICYEGGCVTGLTWKRTEENIGVCECPQGMEYDWEEKRCTSMNCELLDDDGMYCKKCEPGFENDEWLRACRVSNCVDPGEKEQSCNSCKKYFSLDNNLACRENQCSCKNGYGFKGSECPVQRESCKICKPGFHLVGVFCKANECICSDGIGARGDNCPEQGAVKCASCNSGYWLDVDGAKECRTCEGNTIYKDICEKCGFRWVQETRTRRIVQVPKPEEYAGGSFGICKKPNDRKPESSACVDICNYSPEGREGRGICSEKDQFRSSGCKLCIVKGSGDLYGQMIGWQILLKNEAALKKKKNIAVVDPSLYEEEFIETSTRFFYAEECKEGMPRVDTRDRLP